MQKLRSILTSGSLMKACFSIDIDICAYIYVSIIEKITDYH